MPKTLRQLRLEKGETQKEMAEAMGVSITTISQWEMAETTPWPRQNPRIAEHFGISAEQAREAIEETKRQKPETETAVG